MEGKHRACCFCAMRGGNDGLAGVIQFSRNVYLSTQDVPSTVPTAEETLVNTTKSLPPGASRSSEAMYTWHIRGVPSLHHTSPSQSRRRAPVYRATAAAAAEGRPITPTGRGCFARGTLQDN